MFQLSPNFTLEEMTRSQVALRLGIDNTPDDDVVANMEQLCTELLEPVRTIVGVPMHVDSGYRSPALNKAIGGAADSAHMDGRAADLIPIGRDLQTAFEMIRRNPALQYDQLIIECGAWLHCAIAPLGATPRRQAMTASGTPGHWTYQIV